ncbi:MAG: D-hexose-6-phosphate mutarotase [Hylemonella sp.]
MAEAFANEEVLCHGLACRRLSFANGDSVTVAQHGAHVLSWICEGQERLFLSPRSLFDGRAAIRGGVPICFPQFNLRGNLPKHGFVRNLPWQFLAPYEAGPASAGLALQLQSSEATRSHWGCEFELRYTVELHPRSLQLTLALRNRGTTELSFTGALHTYLKVQDISRTILLGLAGQSQWDALTDQHGLGEPAISFSAEFDRVYEASKQPLELSDGVCRVQITQSPSLANTVVWNPGAEKCATLTDMPSDGWRQMLCVEAAQVFQACQVGPGESWRGWQRLTLL